MVSIGKNGKLKERIRRVGVNADEFTKYRVLLKSFVGRTALEYRLRQVVLRVHLLFYAKQKVNTK